MIFFFLVFSLYWAVCMKTKTCFFFYVFVALDIAAALKIIDHLLIYGKRTDIWHLVLLEKRSCLRSRHLVLWSLGTLTGQQRFYGTGLVT
jgi:hypothetical protein